MLGRRAFVLSVVLLVHAAALLLLRLRLSTMTTSAQSAAMQISLIERRDPPVVLPRQTAKPTLVTVVPRSVALPTPLMDAFEIPADRPERPRQVAPPSVDSPNPPSAAKSGSDLNVLCPGRTPPDYPEVSRELREQGEVTMRVELDARGDIDSAVITSSSGIASVARSGFAISMSMKRITAA